MKRLHKLINWLLLSTLLLANSPLIYAEEIGEAIQQSKDEQTYQDAVTQASSQTVGSDNVNTAPSSSSSEDLPPSSTSTKEEGDAIQQPKVVTEESDAEAELKRQYGEPVAVSGQEQLYRVDDTHFV
ncbi:hypothetical protein, partial [Streptococcus cuniculi]